MIQRSTGTDVRGGNYRPDIDGLRAIAVGSVIACHAFPNRFPGGFIGVDIFFVISGYLITRIIAGEIAAGQFSVVAFYKRRICRIYPALVVFLSVNLLLGWGILYQPEFQTLGQHVMASALFGENLLLWSEAGYFNPASQTKPLLHLWSLAIEEQFYIVWPLILMLSRRWNPGPLVLALSVAGLSFAINLHDIRTDPAAAYYSPLGRSWELMVGAVLALLEARRPDWLSRWRHARSIAGVVLIGGALVLIRPETAFPGFWALLPTLGACLLISGGREGIVNTRILALPPLVWGGLISYPLYLWHWLFFSYLHLVDGRFTLPVKSACILAAVVLAAATYLLIERPLRARSQGAAQPMILLAAMIGVAGASVVIAKAGIPARLHRFSTPDESVWAELSRVSGNKSRNMDGIYHLGGARQSSVLFIGDSQMGQYAVRLDRILDGDAGLPEAVMAVGGGCIPVRAARSDEISRKGCWAVRDEAYHLADQARFKRIVIGAAWDWYLQQGDYYIVASGKRLPLVSAAGRQAMFARMAIDVARWQQAGKEVMFILNVPASREFELGGWQLRVDRNAANYPANSMVRIAPEQWALRRELRVWALSRGVTVIDPFDAICQGALCRATTAESLPVYKDARHLNPSWTAAYGDFVDRTLAPLRAK